MKVKLEIDTDEPALVLVIPLGRRTPSVKPPRKCSGERKLVVVTGESVGDLIPFERRKTA